MYEYIYSMEKKCCGVAHRANFLYRRNFARHTLRHTSKSQHIANVWRVMRHHSSQHVEYFRNTLKIALKHVRVAHFACARSAVFCHQISPQVLPRQQRLG